ncbi:hypothetical protein FRC11_004729, partial [Ceratobasidium sp. 423]
MPERFEEVVVDGKNIWQNYSGDMDIIIAHPNGWGIREQAFLRGAAVTAGFTTSEKARTHVRFVTEAEASVHFCMHYTGIRDCLRPGINFAVCDAGGSTVDTTLYTVESDTPKLRLSEKRASACVQSGSIFVDKKAELHLRQHFEKAGLSAEQVDEYVTTGINDFKLKEKLRFNGATELRVKVTSARIKHEGIGIRGGALKLPSAVVRSNIFDPCVDDIVASVDGQLSSEIVTHLLLVGGFGTNPYLYQQLKTHLEHTGCQVTTPNEATSKAVADGALIWHCANVVTKRVPRLAYGIMVDQDFDENNREHRKRNRFKNLDGCICVTGYWSPIVPKGVPVDCDAYSRETYYHLFPSPHPGSSAPLGPLIIYSSSSTRGPKWVTSPSGSLNEGFHRVCTVTVELQEVWGALEPMKGRMGDLCWALRADVCIRFGRTELEGFLEWEEN